MKDIQKIKEFFSKPTNESLTAGYPHRKTSGENFEKIIIAEPIDDATKNKMIKNFRAADWDAKPNNSGGITAIKKTSMNEANGFKSGKEFINIKLKNYPKAVAKVNDLIGMIGESNFTMEMAEWIFDFFNNDSYESPVNEAKSEDKVDTITMDIPLFLRMLEYSREDASQDMDLHDVTEKANVLGKEKGILSMEDYEEIVGAAEEIDEATDYMKRRKTDDYAASKTDKPKKPYNPTYSGKTDYMKRREKELAEAILAKLKK